MNPRDGSVITIALILAPLAKLIEFVAGPAVGGPDILAGLSVCVGWLCDMWYALPAGFVLGLIEDVVTARCLGSRAIALALASLVAAGIRSILNPDRLILENACRSVWDHSRRLCHMGDFGFKGHPHCRSILL